MTAAHSISAFFDDESDAEDAVDTLISNGVSRDAITMTPGNRHGEPPRDHMGFFDALTNFFFTEEQRNVYAEGLRRGGYLVTVQEASQAQHDIALKILAKEGSIDIDERAEQWRAEGWVG